MVQARFDALLDAQKRSNAFLHFFRRFHAGRQLFRKTHHGPFLVGKGGVQPILRQCEQLGVVNAKPPCGRDVLLIWIRSAGKARDRADRQFA